MMKLKKSIYFIFILYSAILFTGCSENNIDDYATNEGYLQTTGTSETNKNDSDNETAKKGVSKENVKVGVLYISNPLEESSGYSYTHDLGIQGMEDNLGLTENQIVRKVSIDDGDKDATKEALIDCINQGCNVIFATSWGYMETTAELAEEYPDIYFSHGTGYMNNGKNFNNYFGRIYQARYLSGLVAGMNTSTNKIGYVAAQDNTNAEVTGGIDAFAIGVYEVNPEALVYVKITNSWFDPEAEEAASIQLLDLGCDVMAQHCDTAYPLSIAEERGVYGIGYNSDMAKETPDSCLCSVIWNWSAYYTTAVQSIIDGTWDGSNYYGGMADSLVAITSLADFCVDETQEKVDVATENILSGSFNVFDGVLETNEGNTVGEEGNTLDDATITGGIDWYYKNVQIVD